MKTKLFILIASAMVLASCSIAMQFSIYNNSPEDIDFCRIGKKEEQCISIKPGMHKRFQVINPPSKYLVRRAGQSYVINFEHIPPQNAYSKVYCSFWRGCSYPVQYQSTGEIYLLGKEQEFPVTEFVKQPQGFPLLARPNA